MPLRGDWHWYITIAAVREWMHLTGRGGELEDSNPEFVAAQNELGDLSLTATLSESATAKQINGASVYRGSLPQLVRVTRK